MDNLTKFGEPRLALQVRIQVSRRQKERWDAAAKHRGMPTAQFIREATDRAAELTENA